MHLRAAFVYAVLLISWSSFGFSQNPQVAIGDLNGDGKPDIVVANPSLNNIGIFLNAGGGALGPGAFLAMSGRPDSVFLADINADGHLDIILVTVDSSAVGHLQIMLGDGHGGFAAPVTVPTGSASPNGNTVIADFNGDGFPDIAFGIAAAPPQVGIVLGDGHGNFSAPHVIPVANDTTFATGLLLLDANKDGKPDLVLNTGRVASGFLHESFLLLNDGAANFSVSHLSSTNFFTDTAGWVTAAADFNSDGFVDLLFAPNSPSFTIFGDGHGGTLSTLDAQPFLGPPQGFAADVDGNQTIDLVSPIGSYFPGNGHGGFGDPISLGLPQGSTLIAVADMNGDSKPDFIVQSGTDVSIVLNTFIVPASISASTVLQLSASANTTSVGLPVTLAASISSYGGTPMAGNVTFFDGATILGSAPVNPYGVAALSTTFSGAGLHNSLTATFSGGFDAVNNTFFLLSSNASDPRSISVNTSQPTASAPTVTLTAFPNPARVHNPVTFTAVVTSSSGTPTGNVIFTADGNVVSIGQVASGGITVVRFPAVGLHNIQATYGGDATFPQATSTTLVEDIRLSVPADFTITASPQSATIKAGQSATFNLTISPVGDMASTVGFSCSGLPAASTCSFSPATLTPGINPVSTTLTVTTTAPSAVAPLNLPQPGPLFWLFVLAGSSSLVLLALFHRSAVRRAALVWAAMGLVFLLGSCGGGSGPGPGPGSNGTPPGASSITVTATSATSHTSALTITVTP